ncbi:MAG: CHAD domain-containing protein, partial [Acidisphaera sp.]|nr:CHAD domain-containing protein [Acidisphaera sp.]
MTTGTLQLDLSLHPDDLAPLMRLPGIVRAGTRVRPSAVQIVWHDTPDAALAADGLALAERRQGRQTRWRLERVLPNGAQPWPPGAPPAVIAEADDPQSLDAPLPHPLLPLAAFEGQIRAVDDNGLNVCVLSGELRAVARARPVCRVLVSGAADAVAPFVRETAQTLRLAVPPSALACEAFGTARPPVPARRSGAPALNAHQSVSEAFAFVVAHLADVMLYQAAHIVARVPGPEPVHQMRVALRRLRSASKLFGKAVTCPELQAVAAELKSLGQVLGPARDWDVFTAGAAASVASVIPDHAAIERLVQLSGRRRDAAYATLIAYLEGAAFRQLGLSLATLAAIRPWERPEQPSEQAAEQQTAEQPDRQTEAAEPEPDLRAFAARALRKRWDR